eukprot:scaffold520059_cov40-Prasinocladus_malaysianus.AAC.1
MHPVVEASQRGSQEHTNTYGLNATRMTAKTWPAAYLSGLELQEDVIRVPIPQANDVSNHRVDGHAASVGQPALKPLARVPVHLQEEVTEHREEAAADLIETGRREHPRSENAKAGAPTA